MSKKTKDRDSRLQRGYGITLEERLGREKQQKHRCDVCKKKRNKDGSKFDFHVDHWHALSKTKVTCLSIMKGVWFAYNEEFRKFGYVLPLGKIAYISSNKREAVAKVKKKLKRMANRGLVCWPCNAGLHRWDDLKKLKRAVKYLDRYFKRLEEGDHDFGRL